MASNFVSDLKATQIVSGSTSFPRRSKIRIDSAASITDDIAGDQTVINLPSTSADAAAAFLVLNATASLANERVLTGTNGIATTDAGAGGAFTMQLDGTAMRVSGSSMQGHLRMGGNDSSITLWPSSSATNASTGSIRFGTQGTIYGRSTGATNIKLLDWGAGTTDDLIVGSSAADSVVDGITVTVNRLGTQRMVFDSAGTQLTGSLAVSGPALSLGSAAATATSGSIRLSNNSNITVRNNAGNNNVELASFGIEGANVATFGDRTINGDYIAIGSLAVTTRAGGSVISVNRTSGFEVTGALAVSGTVAYGVSGQRVRTLEVFTSSNAGTVNLFSIEMASSSTLDVAADVHAYAGTLGNSMIARNYAAFFRAGAGVVANMGTEDDTSTKSSGAGSLWTTAITSSGNNVLVTMTTDAASTQIVGAVQLGYREW